MRRSVIAGERAPRPRRVEHSTPEAGQAADAPRWLLLIHHLPPKPDYFRVKVRRRLQRLGAVALKNSVYVLPRTEGTTEDFEWLLREITAEGGGALLCAAALLEGLTDAAVEATFNRERDADYDEIADAARELARSPVNSAGDTLMGDLARLTRRMEEVSAIDYFGAPKRGAAVRALAALAARARPAPVAAEPGPGPGMGERPVGRTWVTREGVHVDRIASAWLIQRFIDPAAHFEFVRPDGYRPAAGELRFDMFDAEFTHEGACCTFETLLARFGLGDPALRALGEIVHDVDCKDAKFGRAEAAGLAALVDGIAGAHGDDAARLARGAAVLDDLYEHFAARLRRGQGARP
jgi:hypothetical protein